MCDEASQPTTRGRERPRHGTATTAAGAILIGKNGPVLRDGAKYMFVSISAPNTVISICVFLNKNLEILKFA